MKKNFKTIEECIDLCVNARNFIYNNGNLLIYPKDVEEKTVKIIDAFPKTWNKIRTEVKILRSKGNVKQKESGTND